jgi:two-component system, NtrC family, sensor kinase
MATYDIVLHVSGGSDQRFRVGAQGISIGRSPDGDIILDDPLVSRQHAWVGVDDDNLVIRDCGSRNGIAVNGQRMDASPLKHGDAFTVGESAFRVEERSEAADSSTQIPFDEGTKLFLEMVEQDTPGRLPILYRAAQLLGTVFDSDQLVTEILDLIFQALPVRRGYILIGGHAGTDLMLRASRQAADDTSELPLSRTLVDHVFQSRASMLTLNAQQDERFEGSASILDHKIQSAMCAPLCGRRGSVGVIYVDSGAIFHAYNDEDLQLLTAIGRVVGVAVENAQLYRESLERERLAAIGQATAGLGHCVKNILTGMKAGGEFVDQAIEGRNWEWVERGWPLVRRATDRIENLMMNLLTYSRDRKPDLERVSFDDMCVELAEFIRPIAEKNQTQIVVERGDIGIFFADGRAMYRVLLNLVTNAVEACEEIEGERRVTLTTRRTPQGCEIEISDTGIGIAPEVRERLSEAFVSTKGSRGTGLGLACSYKIVREHGGAIDVDSTVGQGARFTVSLPAQTVTGLQVVEQSSSALADH